jgi:hypothetical protein
VGIRPEAEPRQCAQKGRYALRRKNSGTRDERSEAIAPKTVDDNMSVVAI